MEGLDELDPKILETYKNFLSFLLKKNYIIVTGGAGFVGSNKKEFLIDKTKLKIISIDNYSSGSKKNHIKDKRIKYIKSDTKNNHFFKFA